MTDFVQLKVLTDLNIIEVKQFHNYDRDRPDFHNKYLKMLYFFRWEGITNTIRKYSAHKYKQQRYLTFLIIQIENNKYFNASIQSDKNVENFVIKNEFYPYNEIDFKNIEKNAEYYFNEFNQFGETSNYRIFNIDPSKKVSLKENNKEFVQKYESGLFIYGLGGYVKMFIIHHFKNIKKLACIDYKAWITKDFQKKYRFTYSYNTAKSSFPLLENTKYPIAIIATYHSDHALLASKLFSTNPNTVIFIEKPPTVTLDDLLLLIDLYNKKANIEIGFNRRFIDYSHYVKKNVEGKILIITCSVKEVLINPNHWYLWKNQGTRITGNAVHWFDLGNWWIQSNPVEINLLSNPLDSETSAISVLYQNGSLLNLTISDKGNSLRGVQEKIEIRFDNQTIFINDFITMTHNKNNGIKYRRYKLIRDKGHNTMYNNFNKIVHKKASSNYSVSDLIKTSLVTYYASFMLKNNIRNMRIEDDLNKYLNQINI